MRIAIASSGLGHVARGIEAWAADLGRALHERGEDVILCKGAGEPGTDFERVISCHARGATDMKQVHRWMPRFLGWRLGLGNSYQIEQATFTWNLLKILRREKVAILHVQDPQVAILVQRARRLGLVAAKTILAHGTEEPFEFQRRIKYLQHLAPWHLEEARAAGFWKPTWTAIPNFIDTELFRPSPDGAIERDDGGMRTELGIPPQAVVVLCVAAIKSHHKRVDYILSEYHRLRTTRPDLPVYFVLAGGAEPETERLVKEGMEQLGDRVRFLVRFPRARMPELYRAADLFLLGSLKEMMPIALLEATASGLPCVVNAHPVMQWMVGSGGIAIDMAPPGALMQALVQLLDDPGLRARLGRQARQHCLDNFSQDRVVDQILQYYEVVAGQRQPVEAS